MKYRSWFFSTPDTSQGTRFNKNNKPTKKTFWELFKSIPFFLEPDSEGTETRQGLFKKATNDNVKNRDSVTASVMPSQIPKIEVYNNEDDISEIARNGIGMTIVERDERKDLFLKLRSDSLGLLGSLDTDLSYFVISQPFEENKNERSKRIQVKAFLEQYVATAVAGFTESQINAMIDAKLDALSLGVDDIDIKLEPQFLLKIGDAAAGYTMVKVTKNSQPFYVQNVDILEVVGLTLTKELVFGGVKITVDTITNNFGSALVKYTADGKSYTTRLFAAYVPTTEVVIDPPPPGDPTWDLEITPLQLDIMVDENNFVVSENAYVLVQIVSSIGDIAQIHIDSFTVGLEEYKIERTAINDYTIKVTILSINGSAAIEFAPTEFAGDIVTVTANVTMQPAEVVYTLETVPANSISVETDVDGKIIPAAAVEIILKADGVAITLPKENVIITLDIGVISYYINQGISPTTSSILRINELVGNSASISIGTNLQGITVDPISFSISSLEAPL
ncbi:MAG: hypothetical protein JXR64_02910 [Spirochaetales bacterium]|nr:hypothetical protein [Spirochaetales bacterium]